MDFISETRRELVTAYFQLAVILVFDIPYAIGFYFAPKENSTILWIIGGIFGFITLISLVRVVLLHLSIYYWKRGK